MQYNLYISYKNGNYNLFGISDEQLRKVIHAYLKGEKDVTVRGSRHIIDGTRSLRIFQHDVEGTAQEVSKYYLDNIHFREKGFAHFYLPPDTLLKMGKEVTENFIQDREYGELENTEKMKDTREQRLRESFVKSSYEAANSAHPTASTQTMLKTQLPFGMSGGLFWSIITGVIAAAFFLGRIKYDIEKINLSDQNKALADSIKIRDNTIKQIRHNSDSALYILGHMPYQEMQLDTFEFRKVQTTIESAGAALYLNK
jgi:hypothetical protein